MKNTHSAALNKVLDESNLSFLHWKVWFLSAMGIFIDGFDLFIIGIALPLIKVSYNPSPVEIGLLGVSCIIGAIIGSISMGYLTDKLGRRIFYIADMVFCIMAAVLTSLSWSMESLIFFRFVLGIGIGADYPICASYISEFMPSKIRGRMIIAGFSFQAFGMLAAALSGIIILKLMPGDLELAWRLMFLVVIIPASIVLYLRLKVPESPRWLLSRGHTRRAATIIHDFVPGRKKDIDKIIATEKTFIRESAGKDLSYFELFSPKFIRRTILVSVPWFLMDIATYGVGIFTPLIIGSIIQTKGITVMDTAVVEAQGAAFVNVFLILGFLLNIIMVEAIGRIKLQLAGFLGMAAGLGILAYASCLPGGSHGNVALVFMGFIMFNLMMNMGPNATTFMLPVELFPTHARASAHGLASAAAKAGATFGVFILPIMKASWGIASVLIMIAVTALLGFAVTYAFRVEPKGKSLDDLEPWEAGKAIEH